MPLQKELETALSAVALAAKICQSVQSRITRESIEKKDRSPVTIADFASQAAICRALSEAFPQDEIVGEEEAAALKSSENARHLSDLRAELGKVGVAATDDDICRWIDRGGGKGGSRRFWTLDPIDGTKGFLRGEQYAVSLALIIDGRIELGVLGCPNLPTADAWDNEKGALMSAVRGSGAQLRPLSNPNAAPQSVRTSSTARAAMARVCESVESGHSAQDVSAVIMQRLGITSTPVRMDSQAKYATVARGESDIYLRLPTRADYREKIWDHAGGVVIVEEAGGRVTDVDGRDLDFSLGRELSQNRGVIVTNGQIHTEVLEAVKSALG
jgi:3'(2'), 5'-bisphosphate nucleotidase